MKYFATVNGRDHEVEVLDRAGKLQVTVDGRPVDLSYEEVDRFGQVALRVDGRAFAVSIAGREIDWSVTLAGRAYEVVLEDEREQAAHAAERERQGGGGTVTSVMPGVVVSLLVAEGDEVAEGQPLLVLEAMKMQNEIPAPADARVAKIHVSPGEAVAAGGKLMDLAALEEDAAE